MQKLHELYLLGASEKKKKVSAERALEILKEEVIATNWYMRLLVTIPKIKVFFSTQPSKQKELIEEALQHDTNNQEFDQLVAAQEQHEASEEDALEMDCLLDLDE